MPYFYLSYHNPFDSFEYYELILKGLGLSILMGAYATHFFEFLIKPTIMIATVFVFNFFMSLIKLLRIEQVSEFQKELLSG